MTTPTTQQSQASPAATPQMISPYARDSGEILQATALNSFRYECHDNKSSSDGNGNHTTNGTKPQLIHIASSNVLVDTNMGYIPAPEPLSPPRHNTNTINVSAAPYTNHSRPLPTAVSIGPRTFRGRIVKEKDIHLPDSILAYKQRRQAGTAFATWACAATGLILLGPFGAVIGGSTAYSVSKSLGKARERRLIRTYQEAEQLMASMQ